MNSGVYATVVDIPAPPDQVLRALLSALSGSGAEVTLTAENVIAVNRRYTPTWAVVVGVIGFFLFLLGILAFFVKDTETLTIVLTAQNDGASTRAAISGVATAAIGDRVNHVVTWYASQAAVRLATARSA